MGIKSACCVGCCVTVAIVALLVGINGLMQYRNSELDEEETEVYNVPVNCTLHQIFSRPTSNRDGTCIVRRYVLTVGPLSEGAQPLGSRVAYSNFFPTRCGGTHFNGSRIGGPVDCWARDDNSPYVRVSPVFRPNPFYLHVGAASLAVASVILLAFAAYNVVLWLGVCANIGPFSEDAVRARQQAAERANNNGAGAAEADPFEAEAISVADSSWIADMAYNNVYAKAVIRRFGHRGPEEDESPREPVHEELQAAHSFASAQGDSASTEDRAHAPLTSDGAAQHARQSADTAAKGTGTPRGVVLAVRSDNPGAVAEDGAEEDDAVPECCVCWEALETEAVVFPCFHFACPACVERLARTVRTGDHLLSCPMCRRNAFPSEMRRLLQVGPAVGAAASRRAAPGTTPAEHEPVEPPSPVRAAPSTAAGSSPPGSPDHTAAAPARSAMPTANFELGDSHGGAPTLPGAAGPDDDSPAAPQ